MRRSQVSATRFARTSSPGDKKVITLAGFQRAGMLDWPGRLAATAFVSGCNLRCPYCHNPELVCGTAPRRELSDLLSHLEERRGWLDGVVVSGGEPTMHHGLADLLSAIHEIGLPVKLDTNGTQPDVLASLLDRGLVDFVAMDVKSTPERYVRATSQEDCWPLIDRSIALVLSSGVDHEFRTTCYPPAVGPDDMVHIAARLCGAARYVLQQFRPKRTLDVAALSVKPHEPQTLRRVAERCSLFVPTVVRGV